MGIEPTLAAWEAAVLPLNYTRGATYLATLDKAAATRVTQTCTLSYRRGVEAEIHTNGKSAFSMNRLS